MLVCTVLYSDMPRVCSYICIPSVSECIIVIHLFIHSHEMYTNVCVSGLSNCVSHIWSPGLNITACRSAQCRAQNVQVDGGMLRLLSELDTTDKTRWNWRLLTQFAKPLYHMKTLKWCVMRMKNNNIALICGERYYSAAVTTKDWEPDAKILFGGWL